jgi:hypothetical protein
MKWDYRLEQSCGYMQIASTVLPQALEPLLQTSMSVQMAPEDARDSLILEL